MIRAPIGMLLADAASRTAARVSSSPRMQFTAGRRVADSLFHGAYTVTEHNRYTVPNIKLRDLDQLFMNANKSSLTWCLCVVAMP